MRTSFIRRSAILGASALAVTALHAAQNAPQPGGAAPAASQAATVVPRAQAPPLPSFPQTYQTDKHRIRVTSIATGLSNPWSLRIEPAR
jgi:glucose/arabinose dehydrogenase